MASDRATKDKEMAAHLKKQGIFHGMRPNKTNAPPVPSMKDVGTAKYRRYLKSIREGKIKESKEKK